MVYTTLLEAITTYQSSKKTQTESAIKRFLLPAFGLKISSTRINAEETKQAQELMATIKLSEITSTELMATLEKGFECTNLKRDSQRYPRSYIKSFINFLSKRNYLKNETKLSSTKLLDSSNLHIPLRRNGAAIMDKSYAIKSKTKSKPSIALSFEPTTYLKDFQIKYPNKEESEILNSIKNYLDKISKDFDGLESFVISYLGARKVTAKLTTNHLSRILGWLYKEGTELNNLSIESIVSVINTKIDASKFEKFDHFLIEEGKKRYEAKGEANKIIGLLRKFFVDYKILRSRTKLFYIKAVINLAKYLYTDITDEDEASNYEDIPIVNRLRVFQNKLPKQPQLITSLPLTWHEVLKVRERLRLEADETHNKCFINTENGKSFRISGKRDKIAIAISLMKFLILSLLTVVPPDRSRTYRELRIGETLKHGLFDESGFISKDLLLNASDAKYYFHLMPEDYKTGESYGEFIGEIPNIVFEDNNSLYDYLDRWIYGGYRKILLREASHDFLFFASRTSKPLKQEGFSSLVRLIFKNKTKLGMGPHKLRHIFCSYMAEVKASPDERDAAAFWMHHSVEMAKAIYTIQEVQDKLSPSIPLMVRMNNLS